MPKELHPLSVLVSVDVFGVMAWQRPVDLAHTGQDIAAMPVTHISEWARHSGVTLDRLYASEEREGGTMAIGTDVPAPSRPDLSVFTPAQWEREKERLIYEAWLKAARAQLRP